MAAPATTITQAYDLWWEGRNDRPLFYVIYPRGGFDLRLAAKPWMAPAFLETWSDWQQELVLGQALELALKSGEFQFIEEAIDLLEAYADQTGHAADGYSFLLPGLGPGALAAMISGRFHFKDTTIWFDVDPPMEWEEILATDAANLSRFYPLARRAVERLAERVGDRFTIAPPDLGGPLDILSSLRGNMNLLMEMVTEPEKIAKATHLLQDLWFRLYEDLSGLIDPVNGGSYTNVFRYLSGKPLHTATCDLSAMISPAMFEQFALPTIRREAEYFGGRLVYHMDGPGQIPHLETLCALEGLHAIQWVPGAGNPDTLDTRWDLLYHGILDAGKKICLGGAPNDPERVRSLLQRFPKEAFFLPIRVRNRKEAEEWERLQDSL